MLVLASVTILTVAARGSSLTAGLRSLAADLARPIVGAVDALTRPIGSFFAGSFNYGQVVEENAQLRATVARLQLQLDLNQSSSAQLAQLLALEHLPYLGNLPTVTAQTIDLQTSNYAATITLGKGTSSGILVGMPVVGAGGLVGEVTATSNSTATVQLVTDAASAVAVRFGTAGNLATAQGQGPGRTLEANYVPAGTSLRPGELFSTSGLAGGRYPAGIPVGRVASASSSAGAAQADVSLTPAADLAHLDYVDVVQWSPVS